MMDGRPMSQIPSDIAGSALQAGHQARDAARTRDAERAAQAHNAHRTAKAVDEAGTTVDTTDNDTAVFADAEGTGSKGRAYEEELLGEAGDEQVPEAADGLTTGADGQVHLDVQA